MTKKAKNPEQLDSWDKEVEEILHDMRQFIEAESSDSDFVPRKANDAFKFIATGDDFSAGFYLPELLDLIEDRIKSSFSDVHEIESLHAIRDKIKLWLQGDDNAMIETQQSPSEDAATVDAKQAESNEANINFESATSWNEISIEIANEDYIEIQDKEDIRNCTLEELGFKDRRNKSDTIKCYGLLVLLAMEKQISKNEIQDRLQYLGPRAVKDLRARLRAIFSGIEADPLPFQDGFYQSAFALGIKPYYRDKLRSQLGT